MPASHEWGRGYRTEMNGVWFIVVLLSAAGCRTTEAKGNKQLTFAVFLSGVFTNQSELIGGEAFLTGLQLALELLNNNSQLLPGYSVNASITDAQVSGCSPAGTACKNKIVTKTYVPFRHDVIYWSRHHRSRHAIASIIFVLYCPHAHTITAGLSSFSQCDGTVATRGLFNQIINQPSKILIIGADCSVACTPISTLAPYWNLVQVREMI